MPSLNGDQICEVMEASLRLRTIEQTGVLTVGGCRNPLFQSAFTEAMIHARDLVKKCEILGQPVVVAEPTSAPNCPTVGDLIIKIRDCVCHSNSDKRKVGFQT